MFWHSGHRPNSDLKKKKKKNWQGKQFVLDPVYIYSSLFWSLQQMDTKTGRVFLGDTVVNFLAENYIYTRVSLQYKAITTRSLA